jgi:uncharacterized membrane protein YeaQ/YmgE (transglycosylase-associated protein family)
MNQDQVFGIIRHVLTGIGGALVAKGVIDEGMALEATGIIMSIVGFVWSYIVKQKKA